MLAFQNLEVYQIAKSLAVETYQTTRKFPADEKFSLTQQMNRAAISVASNIAEGSGRKTDKDRIHFITMAYGSLMELVCQYEISCNLGFIDQEQYDRFEKDAKNLSVKLSNYKKAISSNR